MRPIGIVGIVLIVLGGIVVAMQGVSYVRDREEVQVGPLEVAAEERGFVPPVVGLIAIIAGVALVFAGRRQT